MSPAHPSTRSIPTSRARRAKSFALSMSTYDRLVAFGRKQLNGKWVFDLDKITGELANPRRQPGRTEAHLPPAQGCQIPGRLARDRRGREMVARSLRHRADPRQGTIADGIVDVGRPVQGDRSPHDRSDAAETRQARAAQSRHGLPADHQLEGRQGACDPGRSLGHRLAEGAHRRQRCLCDRDLQARRAGDHQAQRGLEPRLARQAGLFQARDRAVRAGARDPRQFGRARRCRSCRRSPGQRRAVARGQGQAQGDLDAAIQFDHLRLDEQPDPALRQRQCPPCRRLRAAL